MDHRYIDEHSVAERYLDRKLSAKERVAFEAHVVDCQECTDRLMLAEMFHARNGFVQKAPQPVREQEMPLRARFIAHFRPWQLVVIFAAAALLLLAIPTAYFFWELSQLAQP
jgi:anti-sigma factor RsiW